MNNSELLEVLQNPSHYQAAAIAIAKLEFASRKLSEEEINNVKNILLERKLKRTRHDEKVEVVKSKVLETGNVLYDTINPIQTTTPTPEKLTRLVSIVFSVLFIYKVTVNFNLFSAIVKGDFNKGFAYTLYIFPVLFEFVAIFLFWLKKQSGWILLASFCSYSLVEVLYELYYSITLQFKESSFFHFLPQPSPSAYIISLLFYIGTLAVIVRPDIREVYKIDKPRKQNSVIIGTLVGILFLFLELSS